tara:strand:+ start:11374 stop:11784 length:411 start_codon:yes stop_codon:yes gene_type:complete
MTELQLIAGIFSSAGFPSTYFSPNYGPDLHVINGNVEKGGKKIAFSYFSENQEMLIFATLRPGHSFNSNNPKRDPKYTVSSYIESLLCRVSLFDDNSIEKIQEICKGVLETEYNVLDVYKDGLEKLSFVNPSILNA